jgi:hypothetical protein
MAKRKAQISQDERQLAQCVEVRSYTDSNNKSRKSYKMVLGDPENEEEFEIPETDEFKAEKDKFYFPVVFIGEYAKISPRTGKPYIARVPSVAWHEVK